MLQPTFKYIDFGLPSSKHPNLSRGESHPFLTYADKYCAEQEPRPHWGRAAPPAPLPTKTAAVGSKDSIRSDGDFGLFGALFRAWADHLTFRTTPEDWWLPVITKIAASIDAHADAPAVRSLFVGGRKGKETIVVDVPTFSIYDTDYSTVFSTFSSEIQRRIEVEGFAGAVTCSFSTTVPEQRIASQITLMKSMQKYFDYEMGLCGCGLHGLEMGGTEADWAELVSKTEKLQSVLSEAEAVLRIRGYLEEAKEIFRNLLMTFQGKDMKKWWTSVLLECKEEEWGPSGMSKYVVDAYDGWLVQFCTGRKVLKASALRKGKVDGLACWSSCPMKIVDRVRGVEDMSMLVGGVLGYKVHEDSVGKVPAIQPAHGWALFLPPQSPLRSK